MQLLERASQMQALDSALSEVTAGEGCVALVYGEAGIGKTALIQQFTKDKEPAWRVRTGSCDLLFTPRPYGPFRDIALQTEGRLLHLLDSGYERGDLFLTCLTAFSSRPTILVIEDIHWADQATLDLLKYLGRRIRQTACLMILTYRDDEIGVDSALRVLLGDLACAQAVHRIPVPSLSMDAVRELAKDRNVDATALYRLTNGNPFFVTEVLAGGSGIPQTVRDAVLGRVVRLSAAARNLLEAASVAGPRVETWLLSGLSNADAERIEECVSRGMLQFQGSYFGFRHELARQTVLESIQPQRRIELNRMTLQALEQSPETCNDLTRLASHAQGTEDAQAVLKYAPAAAKQAAAAGAHRQAAGLYELALKFASALPVEEKVQMLEAYADEQRFEGRLETFVPVRRQIIEKYRVLGDRLREGASLAMLAEDLHRIGYIVEPEKIIQAAVAMLEAQAPSAELARAYRVQAQLLSHRADFMETVAAAEKAIVLAKLFGDVETLAQAYNLAGESLLRMEDERGCAMLERGLAVSREKRLDYVIGLLLVNWAWALVDTFRLEEASALLRECIEYATQHDDDFHLEASRSLQAQVQLYQGHWREVANLIRQTQQQPDLEVLLLATDMLILGRLGVRRGDAGALQTLGKLLALCTRANYLVPIASAQAGRAEAAWLKGDHQRAIEEARAAYDQAARQRVSWVTGELAFWRWRAGEVFTPPAWIAKPYALQIAGEWRAAAQEWKQRGCPYEQAVALMDGDEAAQLAALEIFERLGARPILIKLKQQLRAKGVSHIPRGPRPSTRGHRFGLSARELEILSCLVKGPSNRAIARQLGLSTRTVEHHVESLLQKTGAHSRQDLVALAQKDNLLAPQ